MHISNYWIAWTFSGPDAISATLINMTKTQAEKRCPGIRQILSCLRKYRMDRVVKIVNEYNTTQLCDLCKQPFDKQRHKKIVEKKQSSFEGFSVMIDQ